MNLHGWRLDRALMAVLGAHGGTSSGFPCGRSLPLPVPSSVCMYV